MWIIASIPFWAITLIFSIAAFCCSLIAFSETVYREGIASGRLEKSRASYLVAGIFLWLFAGIVGLIAAKICS